MKVGIAIPNRNHGHVIGRLLDSVVPQNPDSIVVMDDASDDNSVEVISRYPSVTLIRRGDKTSDHNQAIADIAAGMDADCVTLAAADDNIHDGYVDAVRKFGGGGVTFVDYDIVDDDGAVLARRAAGLGCAHLSPESARRRLLTEGLPLFECGVGASVRSDVHKWLLDRGGFSMGPWNDSIGNAVAACIFGATYIPQPLASFTVSRTGANWHVHVLSNPVESARYRAAIMHFFMHPDVMPLGPKLLSAIARRWGA